MTYTSSGYIKERLTEEGVGILCYRFRDTQRDTMDAWAVDASGEMRAWLPGVPFRLLVEAKLNQSSDFSIYGFMRAREVSEVPLRGSTSRLAVVVNNPLVELVMYSLFRTMSNPQRQRRVFHNEADAIAWLAQPDTIDKR